VQVIFAIYLDLVPVRVKTTEAIDIGPSEQRLTFESIHQLKLWKRFKVSLRTVFFSMEMSADILSGPLRRRGH